MELSRRLVGAFTRQYFRAGSELDTVAYVGAAMRILEVVLQYMYVHKAHVVLLVED